MLKIIPAYSTQAYAVQISQDLTQPVMWVMSADWHACNNNYFQQKKVQIVPEGTIRIMHLLYYY